MLSAIAADPRGESCVCDLADLADVSQPTVSHHLKGLRTVGLLDSERRGTWVWYSIAPGKSDAVAARAGLRRRARPPRGGPPPPPPPAGAATGTGRRDPAPAAAAGAPGRTARPPAALAPAPWPLAPLTVASSGAGTLLPFSPHGS